MRPALLGGSALALVAALGGRAALALDECGPANAGDTVTCTPAGNSFPNGIEYKVVDLTIIVEDGVIIDTATAAGIVSGASGNYGNLVVNAGTSGGAGISISTDGTNSDGIRIVIDQSTTTIAAYGSISTTGGDAEGITTNSDGNSSIAWTGTIVTTGTNSEGIDGNSQVNVDIKATGGIVTAGDFSTGISGQSATGNVIIVSTSDIETKGDFASALSGVTTGGTAQVTIISDGDLTTEGDQSQGLFGQSKNGQLGTIVTGSITTAGKDSSGVELVSAGGKVLMSADVDVITAGDDSLGLSAKSTAGDVLIFSSGNVETAGDDSHAIYAYGGGETRAFTVGDVVITTGDEAYGLLARSKTGDATASSSSDITTTGLNASAIGVYAAAGAALAYSRGAIVTGGVGAHGVEVISGGKATADTRDSITTSGDSAKGVLINATGPAVIDARGDVQTAGKDADALFVTSADDITITAGGDLLTQGMLSSAIEAKTTNGAIAVVSSGAIATAGDYGHGMYLQSAGGGITVSATGSIHSTGQNASGILAISDNPVTIAVDDDVQGGWSNGAAVDITGPAGASTLSIAAGAEVGALSDFALLDDKDSLKTSNAGTVTGAAFFVDGDDTLANSGTWNLRRFADSDGDQVRDKEYVTFMSFGAGTDSLDNTGVLRLAAISGATDFVTVGQIAHPGGGNSDITQEGVEQAFLLGLETFTHSGLITLSDGVAGDLIVITDQADGKTKGANVFTSNGGSLALDVVLDDGSSKQSDVLILDKAELGTGATQVLIANAGGIGGQTTGDGILVVNVRDKSDANEFVLGNTPIAGAYQYDLVFQNAAKTDQNWYLQSSFFEGSLEYPAISSGALATWQSGLGALHDQIRARRASTAAQEAALGQMAALPTGTDLADSASVRVGDGGNAGWLRVSGADMEFEQSGAADFDLDATRAEAGFDVGFKDPFGAAGDWLVAGAFAGYGWSSVGFDSGSEIDFDIATLGAYATYFRGPYYVDALAKLDWLDGAYNSDVVSQDGDLSLPVFGLSLETGFRLDLARQGFYLQPQARLSYAHADDDSFKDDGGATIALQEADSLRGRLGARIGRELSTTAGAGARPVTGNFYLEAAVNQEFLGETAAKVSGLTVRQEMPDTTFELGAGFDIALPKEGVSFLLDADYTFGEEAEGVAATGGLRITW